MFEDYPEDEREMLNSAYDVITRLNKWSYLNEFDSGDGGFLFSRDPVANLIMQQISNEYDGHSGSSMAITMRIMQKIAQEK
jgi:hypothetical protein